MRISVHVTNLTCARGVMLEKYCTNLLIVPTAKLAGLMQYKVVKQKKTRCYNQIFWHCLLKNADAQITFSASPAHA